MLKMSKVFSFAAAIEVRLKWQCNMNIKSLSGNASQTLTNSLGQSRAELNKAAAAIANQNGQSPGSQSFNQALIDARAAATQIEASAEALERTNETLGRFIDTIA